MLLEFRTDRRGYTVWLERDLFGAFVLHRRWYGLYNRRGGTKRQVFDDEQRALAEVERLARVRERHGYRLLSGRLDTDMPAEVETRLEALAKATGRTKTFYAREVISTWTTSKTCTLQSNA
jgi:predicted DNA-binding WGR domain protein